MIYIFKFLIVIVAGLYLSVSCSAGSREIDSADFITFMTGKNILIGGTDKIWKSKDDGKSWVSVFQQKSKKGKEDDFKHIKMIDQNVGYAVGNFKVLKTEDGGNSWDLFFDLLKYFRGKEFLSTEPVFLKNNIYILGDEIICASQDGGKTWKKLSWYTKEDKVLSLTSVNSRILAATFKGYIYDSVDNGLTWEKVGENKSSGKNAGEGKIWPEEGKGAWAIHTLKIFPSGVGYSVNLGGGVAKTEDGGKTWEMVRHPVPAPTEKEHLDAIKKGIDLYIEMFHWSALVFDEKRVFIPSDGGELLYTHDGGKSWNRAKVIKLDGKKSDQDLKSVSMIDANKGWMIGSVNALYKTADGGKTWKQQTYRVVEK